MDDDIETIMYNAEQMLCPKGEPHTGDDNRRDHGHTTCWVIGGLLNEIERLRSYSDLLLRQVRFLEDDLAAFKAHHETTAAAAEYWKEEARRG